MALPGRKPLKKIRMEEDLKIFLRNGRQPLKNKIEQDLKKKEKPEEANQTKST
jgi:hypothetical protein